MLEYFNILQDWMDAQGIRLYKNSKDLPYHVAGRADFERKWDVDNKGEMIYKGSSYCVQLNTLPPRDTLLTLIHELGHILSYRRYIDIYDKFPEKCQRELLAYLFGWTVIRKFDIPVTKQEWRKFHTECWEDYYEVNR